MDKKIVILTTGQPSTNPRMIKEYLSLKEEGYDVKVFYSFWHKWALDSDEKLFQKGEIDRRDFFLVGGDPVNNRFQYLLSKVQEKASKWFSGIQFLKSQQSLARTSSYLKRAALREKADLYIAHNPGALAPAVIAAKKYKAKVGFDAEDYHRGEFKDQNCEKAMFVKTNEDKYIPQCDFITAASPLIATLYSKLYHKKIHVINNVFSKKFLQPVKVSSNDEMTLFWFSQTIGRFRGLETVAQAMELLTDQCNIHLYLMGNVSPGFDYLLLNQVSNKETIHFISPVPPDEVFTESAKYDIGLSLEMPDFENRDVCLTNKLFTYLLAGNCIIFSDTSAHKDFATKYDFKHLYHAGNVNQLAGILLNLYTHRSELMAAKNHSNKLAEEHLNWEIESKVFKALIKQQLLA